MVPWDFGSPSPRAKFVSNVHGYTCTSKVLLFIQNSLHCNKVVCIISVFSRLFQQELCALLRLLPTCYHRNRNIIGSTLYTQGCYPPFTKNKCVYFSKVFCYYNSAWLSFTTQIDVKGFMQWELILNKLYLPPTKCFTSTGFFELAHEW